MPARFLPFVRMECARASARPASHLDSHLLRPERAHPSVSHTLHTYGERDHGMRSLQQTRFSSRAHGDVQLSGTPITISLQPAKIQKSHVFCVLHTTWMRLRRDQ